MTNDTILLSEIIFEEAEPGELLDSIAVRGIAIPVAVIQKDGHYVCTDGRKRLTAAKRLGIARIPVALHQDRTHAGNPYWGAKNHH